MAKEMLDIIADWRDLARRAREMGRETDAVKFETKADDLEKRFIHKIPTVRGY